MSIQYAGAPIISATMTQSTGTRAELSSWIEAQLVAAGWAVAVTATNDWKLNSAITPQNLQMRVRVYDPGSGNCARIKVSNVSEVKIQSQDHWLNPAVGKIWRFIGNKYQFFVMTPGNSPAREFFFCGVPFLPTFLTGVITEAIHSQSNGSSDTNTSNLTSFRTAPTCYGGTGLGPGEMFNVLNGSICESYAAGGGYPCWTKLANLPAFADANATTYAYRWHDLSFSVVEPLIAWGNTYPTDESLIRGQLWDAIWINEAFPADTNITFDGRTYWGITNMNVGGQSNGCPRGTLFVAVS
jgi:hypothetical protein